MGFLWSPSNFIEWVVGFDVCEIDPSDGVMSLVWRSFASHAHFGGGGPFFWHPHIFQIVRP
jgi:methyl coenzyme M reductase beta subunit